MAKDGGGDAILPQYYPRSYDVTQKRSNSRKSSKCFVFLLTFLVIFCIALLGFSSLVLRINSPRVKLRTVDIKNLVYQPYNNNNNNNNNNNFVWLNMTMVTGITIKNNNYGRFKYHDTKMNVFYGNTAIGTARIGGGRVNGRKKRRMDNVTVHVAAKMMRINGGGDSGIVTVKLGSYARFSGEILVLKKIKRYRTAVMNCTMNLKLSNQEIQDLQCM